MSEDKHGFCESKLNYSVVASNRSVMKNLLSKGKILVLDGKYSIDNVYVLIKITVTMKYCFKRHILWSQGHPSTVN